MEVNDFSSGRTLIPSHSNISSMETQISNHPEKSNTLLLITRLFSTTLALLFLFAFAPKLINEYSKAFTGEKPLFGSGWEGIVMEMTIYVFLTGFIFSWWKKCTGGILILLASLIQMGPFLIIDGNLGSLIFGIPLLVSGVLFLIVWKKDTKLPHRSP